MSNVRALLSLALVVPLVACGDDGGGSTPIDASQQTIDAPLAIDAPLPIDAPIDAPVDAPNYDFSCLGNSAPTTATATVTLTGFGRELTLNGATPSLQAATNATITACKGDCEGANNLGSTFVSSSGTFSTASLATGNTPLDGHLRASKTGNWPTRLYPASPLVADQANVPVLMITNSAVGIIGLVAPGNQTQSANNGIVGMFVTDCSNEPIASGATVTFTHIGTNTEITSVINAGQFTGQAAGGYIATNVPPGDVTVAASYNGMVLRAHVVPSVASTVTTTQIRPGW
ncbi:MAG: carboxypeptidase-like regulatory domain-containing protein [Kofleriaceae bacterium]|nr:carboxypeptidase-like regulatory domain-containing protein [Kofleriaceae bacterium]